MTTLDQLMPIERAAVVAASVLCGTEAEELAAVVRPIWPSEEPAEAPIVYTRLQQSEPDFRGWFQ